MPINISGGAGSVYDATPSAFALSKMGADTAWRLSDANRESIRGLEQSVSGTVRDVAGRIDRRQEAEKQRAQQQALLNQQQEFQTQQAAQAQQSVMAQAMESERYKTQESHSQRIQQGWDYSPDVKKELDQIEQSDRQIASDMTMSNGKKIEALRLNNRRRAVLVPNVRAKTAIDSFNEMKVGDEDENGVQRVLQPRGDGSFELKELLGPKKRAAQIEQEARAKQDDQVRNSLKDASQLIKDGMSRNDVAAMLEAQNDHGRFTSFIGSLKSNSSGNGEFVEQEIPAKTLSDWTELAAKATVDEAGSKRPLNAKEQQDMVQGLYKTYQGVLKARHEAAREAENSAAVGRLSASTQQPMLSAMQVVQQPSGMVAEGGPEMMGQIHASVPRETEPVESAPVVPQPVPVESVPRETAAAPTMTARPNLPSGSLSEQAAQGEAAYRAGAQKIRDAMKSPAQRDDEALSKAHGANEGFRKEREDFVKGPGSFLAGHGFVERERSARAAIPFDAMNFGDASKKQKVTQYKHYLGARAIARLGGTFSTPPVVLTKDDLLSLPPGTNFVDKDGNAHKKKMDAPVEWQGWTEPDSK